MSSGFNYAARLTGAIPASTGIGLWQLQAAAGVSLLVQVLRVSFVPKIVNSVGFETPITLSWGPLASAGSSGTPVTPVAIQPRNMVPAATTVTALLASPGPFATVEGSANPSVTDGWRRTFKPSEQLLVGGGRLWGLSISPLAFSVSVALDLSIEEL